MTAAPVLRLAQRGGVVRSLAKAYVLLVFAGIWALMQGLTTMVRAFQIRAVREEL